MAGKDAGQSVLERERVHDPRCLARAHNRPRRAHAAASSPAAAPGPGERALNDPAEFFNPYRQGFARVAVAVPRCRVADPAFNAEHSVALLHEAASAGAALVAFPELGLSAYTCDDLFHQRALLDGCEAALARLVAASEGIDTVAVLGLPLRVDHSLFNCAAVLHRGRLLGIVPKTYLPNYGEFYEARQFNPADHAQATRSPPARPDRALRRGAAVRGHEPAALQVPRRDLRGPVGADPALVVRGAGRRHAAAQPVGVQRHRRQVGLPAWPGRIAIGALPGGVPVFVGGPGRIDHRPGLGRPVADLRERPAAGRIAALCRGLAPDHGRRRPGPPGAGTPAPDQLRPVGGAPCRSAGALSLRALRC